MPTTATPWRSSCLGIPRGNQRQLDHDPDVLLIAQLKVYARSLALSFAARSILAVAALGAAMAAKWPHLSRLALHSDQEIRMRQTALMGDNCHRYALAATGAQGCQPLIKAKQTMPG